MRFLPANAQHIGARHSQQDSFGFADPDDAEFVRHGGFLAIVCDGMGGMEHGDLAGRTAVRTFLESYGRKTPQESVPAALERSAREANARVVALAHSLGRADGVGTTLVAATLLDGGPGQARLYYVSVGDSGLFHIGGGQMRMVNHPHVFANYLDNAVARGTLSAEAALSHPERESLTSYIGAEVLEEIDLSWEPLMLAEGDTILVASDGMFKTLAPAEIAACFTGDPQGWPERLVNETLARQRESQDNVTVISVTVEAEPVSALPASGAYESAPDYGAAPTAQFAAAQQGSADPGSPFAATIRMPAEEDPMPPPAAVSPAGSEPGLAPPAPPAPTAAPAPPSFSTASFPTASFPTGSSPAPSFPTGSFPTSSFPTSSFPTSSFPTAQMGAAPAPGGPYGTPGMADPGWPRPGTVAPMGPGPSASASAPAAKGSSRAAYWIVALVLLAGAGGGGWWYWSHRSHPDQTQGTVPPKDGTPLTAPERDPRRPIVTDPNAPDKPGAGR